MWLDSMGSEIGHRSSPLSEPGLGPAFHGSKHDMGTPVQSHPLIFALPVPLPLRIPRA